MPHITLNSEEPGIRGLFRYRPEMALPLNALADALLCGDNTLTRGERELIATYVSGENDCRFCYSTHAAMAAAWLPEGMRLVQQVREDLDGTPISAKMKALLRIAGSVAVSGRKVSGEQVEAARDAGATDVEIHDTVLIAAAFCMFNRYVDGLDTIAPDDPDAYAVRARMTDGYVATLRLEQRGI
ncbi:carboxymuconolactone decarboxylase family protein [Streptosporangiaceae bacterium NEAU-GS5]|nr:carboxymuconolactone decarboxylase family protein [Streptosporangiaceae bacterium NEAU-GS5]